MIEKKRERDGQIVVDEQNFGIENKKITVKFINDY